MVCLRRVSFGFNFVFPARLQACSRRVFMGAVLPDSRRDRVRAESLRAPSLPASRRVRAEFLRLQLCHPCPPPGVIVSAPSLYGRHPCPTPGVIVLRRVSMGFNSVIPARLQACPRRVFMGYHHSPCAMHACAPEDRSVSLPRYGLRPCPTLGVFAPSSFHSVLRARLQACPNAAPSLFGLPLYPPGPTPGVP